MSNEHVEAACAYCHLPVTAPDEPTESPQYCCFGCRLAAEITGQSGDEGAATWTLARLGLAIFLSLNVMMFTMVLWTQDLYDARAVGSGPLAASLADLFRYLCLLLSLPVLWLLGLPLLENALATRRRDLAAADLLIIVGIVAAYVYSVISVIRGAGHVYFEVACAVLVMVTIGRWLEATGKLRTTKALDSLERLLPERVRVAGPHGRESEVSVGELACGDRLRVLAGERIATDGQVLSGCASVDQQLLTGESRPATKRVGDAVLGGSLNLDGELVVEVSAPANQGSLARLIELVRTARATKGRYQRLADQVAKGFLPAVFAVAAGTLAYHLWQGHIETAVMASLAVLLIACPCALGLATPMAVWAALGNATRRGVLFRHGEALERLATIQAVRFDKTGTLTTGSPRVAGFDVDDEGDRDEVERRALRLAGASAHVFSQAIVRHHGQLAMAGSATCGAVTLEAGRGMTAVFDAEESPTLLGSLRWLEESGLRLSAAQIAAIAQAREAGLSLTAIGWHGRVRAIYLFAETLRPAAQSALAECRELGCDVAVLTGDEPSRAQALAAQLGVPVLAGLLPEGKVAALADARRAFGPVAMVGDGVNDAPALVASDLGIALGCGADLSRQSALVCLLDDDVSRLPWAIALSRRSVRVMRQNLFWAFGYNSVAIALAAAGWLNPAWAAVAMVVSSLFVVSNSLRLCDRSPEDEVGMLAPPQARVEAGTGDIAETPTNRPVPQEVA